MARGKKKKKTQSLTVKRTYCQSILAAWSLISKRTLTITLHADYGKQQLKNNPDYAVILLHALGH